MNTDWEDGGSPPNTSSEHNDLQTNRSNDPSYRPGFQVLMYVIALMFASVSPPLTLTVTVNWRCVAVLVTLHWLSLRP